MIHYHGLPITPITAAVRAISSGHAFVSFAHPEQLQLAQEVSSSFALDNGAFSAWKAECPIINWTPYYSWVSDNKRHPAFDFAVIPDVIDGTELDNDLLVAAWPLGTAGAPVWHLHESINRLKRLSESWQRVCLGSSGQYATIGTAAWYGRMSEAMDAICGGNGMPVCKLHGLRMLDPRIFTRFPFSSADSCNIARNIGIDKKWSGGYPPATKDYRAVIMRERIEQHQAAQAWDRNQELDYLQLFSLEQQGAF